MQAIKCELCGSNNLLKEDEYFVCQHCRTKYTPEQARKMLVEGTVKIDETDKIQGFLDLSQSALISGNGESAFDYANKALEIAPQNSLAWLAKMKSIEFMGTLGNLRIMEVVEAGKNAILYASEEDKRDVTVQVYEYELTRSLGLLMLAMQKLKDTDQVQSTFETFAVINFLQASNNTLKADSAIVNIYEGITNEAIAMLMLIPDEAMAVSPKLPKLASECAKQYQYETNALRDRYNIYGAKLLDSAIKARNEKKQLIEDKANKTLEIALKQRDGRIKSYWEDHPDEKSRLDREKADAELRKKQLENKKGAVPGAADKKKYEEQIESITTEIAALSMFKGKEKKTKQAKIDSIKSKLDTMRPTVDSAVAAIQREIDEVEKTIADINDELTKER